MRFIATTLASGAISIALMGAANAAVIFDSIPEPLPGNVVSLGYQATSTYEFGDKIQFAGSERSLTTVTVTMSDWAKFSEYPGLLDPLGYYHPLTLNLYNVDGLGGVGSLIQSVTINAFIPWRPEVYAFNGIAFNVTFDFTGTIVPDQIIFGLAYNTQTHGYSPIGSPGPYNSLNFGVTDYPDGETVGDDIDPNSVFWYTSYQGFCTGCTANVFSEDFGWGNPYYNSPPLIQFNAVQVPEPETIALLGAGLLVLGFGWLRRPRVQERT